MSADMVAHTIQLILAPVVMVTACALVLNGLLARYAAINDRLRSMAQERLDLLKALGIRAEGIAVAAHLSTERLQEIDLQAPILLRHHQLVHNAALTISCAIVVFVACMFVIGAAAVTTSDWLATAALFLFLAGTGVLLLAALLTALEVRTSHQALQYEVKRVWSLGTAGV